MQREWCCLSEIAVDDEAEINEPEIIYYVESCVLNNCVMSVYGGHY